MEFELKNIQFEFYFNTPSLITPLAYRELSATDRQFLLKFRNVLLLFASTFFHKI